VTQGETESPPKPAFITPREALLIFTAGWLGGTGLLTALDGATALEVRLIAGAEAVAAVLWFIPRLRMSGLGAMMAILVLAILHHLLAGIYPGALVFYLAVVVYLAVDRRKGG
jgi:hypothetical protein